MSLDIRKFAAIDIGSNAIRLLVSNVISDGTSESYKKVALVRLPIRLGQEAFTQQEFSPTTIDRFVDGMRAYKYLMKAHQVIGYRACATSAMREAANGAEVARLVAEQTGIKIDIIDGKDEARIIHSAHFKDKLDPTKNFIYIDVGGGSTEITLFSNGKVQDSQSFNVGTIRLLNNMVSKDEWNRLKKWIKHETIDLEDLETIGSGGNINKLYKLSKVNYPKPLKYGELVQIHNLISDMSIDERIKSLKLNPDRADVIIPASTIFVNAMKWAKTKTIHVPKIGLADGLIMELANAKNVERVDY